MATYYEGRDILRTEDIYGSQSSTALKNRNIDQEQYVPVVIKNVPDVYQRQAELNKSIRNPHYNDYRYDMKQQHAQFIPNSFTTEYRDSLDTFKKEQETIKNGILKDNSLINYDFIRMQKNKNSYQKLNPPFANLHSDINERQQQYQTLKSPLHQYLQNNSSNGFEGNKSSSYGIQQRLPSYSINQSPINKESTQKKIQMNRSSSQAQINPNINYSQQINNSSSIFKPEDQSPQNANQVKMQQQYQSVPQQTYQIQQNSPIQRANGNYYQQAQPQQQQQQQYQQQSYSQQSNYQDQIVGDSNQQLQQLGTQQVYQQSPQPQLQTQKIMQGSPSVDQLTQSSTIGNRKTYKPYNIILHDSYIPYTPKFDMPEITWDKYDRQMFRNFEKKAMPPVEIIKSKNDQMNVFSDYTTWNQKYGEAK